MAVATGYTGDIKVDTSNTLNFVGAWKLDIERETKEGKPYILAAGTGAKPITAGALKTSGSLSGDVLAGANTGRAYVMTKLKSGARVTLDLIQADGVTFNLTGVLITKASFNNDSEGEVTLDVEFLADDYTYDDNSAS